MYIHSKSKAGANIVPCQCFRLFFMLRGIGLTLWYCTYKGSNGCVWLGYKCFLFGLDTHIYGRHCISVVNNTKPTESWKYNVVIWVLIWSKFLFTMPISMSDFTETNGFSSDMFQFYLFDISWCDVAGWQDNSVKNLSDLVDDQTCQGI